MKRLRDLESVGWIFFLVFLGLLLYPAYYASKQLTYDMASPLVRYGFAAFGAAAGAGLVSWAVNEVLYRISQRRHNERRKAEKKKKRAKKRKKK